LSVVGVLLNSVAFHLGMPYIPATLIMLLENLAPFFVLALAFFLDHRVPSRAECCCLLVAFCGLVLIVVGKGGMQAPSSAFALGVAFELVAGATWGVYNFYSARWLGAFGRDGRDAFYPMLNFLAALFAISAVLSTPLLPRLPAGAIQLRHLAMVVFLGVFQSGLAFVLWNYALIAVPAATASIAFYATVVFTCVNEVLVMGLRPSAVLLTGGSLILASVVFLSLPRRGARSARGQSPPEPRCTRSRAWTVRGAAVPSASQVAPPGDRD
jgi:drug/metabolite transporter (DMT)-like permease